MIGLRILLMTMIAACVLANAARAETAAGFLSQKFADCDAFIEAVETARFDDPPDLFTCHKYEFKGLYLYGYFRFHSRKVFGITVKTNKHGQCDGKGDLGWDGRHLSASGRMTCKDGSTGGLAFEMEEKREDGAVIRIGTILAGIDGHESRYNEEDRISADFYVYDQAAVKAFLKRRRD